MDLAEHIDDRSARGIAAAVGRLITAGDLPVGSRLPTVRELSRSLGVSPTRSRNRLLNEPRLENPTAWQTSVTVRFVARSRSCARSMRRSARYAAGVVP